MIRFLKDWALIIAIFAGIIGYFTYAYLPIFDFMRSYVNDAVEVIQPLLIFSMLFLTFSKMELRDLRLRKWHCWLLLFQTLLFSGIGVILILLPQSGLRVILEGAMLCLICPTATAAAVITRKLGGNVSSITTYTILINMVVAVIIPVMVPFVHPQPGISFLSSAALILAKVFPLLLLPLIITLTLRKFAPAITLKVARYQDLSFYIWIIALALAMALTTRSIMRSNIAMSTQLGLVVVSFICCFLQFYIGRKIGHLYGEKITAGQSLGQKNTVLAIWMGYTFFTPVTAIAGGFYSIWHNLANTYQLRHARQK